MVMAPPKPREVRCWHKSCAKRDGDQPRLLFKVEAGSSGTIFMSCPRCGTMNIVDLMRLC